MSTAIWVIVAIVVVAIVAAVVWYMQQKRKSDDLRGRFGPEYERAVQSSNSRKAAESELERRQERVDHFDIRPLSSEDRGRFANSWQLVQTQFVDDPSGAVADADSLIGDVMLNRGYPVGDFEQRAADVSVDHPDVVSNYREAHRLAQMSERGEANTEDLRKAMVHYRSLFDDLLGAQEYASSRDGDLRAQRLERAND
ncbi:MAG: hypothetical protein WBW04_16670 [Nitrolancea sp.]